MSKILIVIGIIIAIIGFILPVPGPIDDPVDFIGYLIVILGVVKRMFEAKRDKNKQVQKK